jgi:Domain of unknown function (DUF4878)
MFKIAALPNVFALMALLVLCSCNAHPFEDGPAKAVKEFYFNCNAGEYTKADAVLSSDAKAYLQGDLGINSGGLRSVCEHTTRNFTVTAVDLKSQKIEDDTADVIVTVHYNDGSSSNESNSLVKENGAWLITPNP